MTSYTLSTKFTIGIVEIGGGFLSLFVCIRQNCSPNFRHLLMFAFTPYTAALPPNTPTHPHRTDITLYCNDRNDGIENVWTKSKIQAQVKLHSDSSRHNKLTFRILYSDYVYFAHNWEALLHFARIETRQRGLECMLFFLPGLATNSVLCVCRGKVNQFNRTYASILYYEDPAKPADNWKPVSIRIFQYSNANHNEFCNQSFNTHTPTLHSLRFRLLCVRGDISPDGMWNQTKWNPTSKLG